MRIGCLQFAPQVGDVDNNLNRADAVLSKADPGELDLLVLPELSFSGYNFTSLNHIAPYLEHSGSGITSLWARTTALKYSCNLVVGYPEKVDITEDWPASPEYYNAALVVNEDGETIANYRKSFLYYTDETWALEGDEGFYRGTIPGLGRTSIGICMDINPYKFEAPWHAHEFAFHVMESYSNLVIMSMAWLTRADAQVFTSTPNEPDMDTLTYWVARLEPLIRSENDDEIIVVFCNRTGIEDDAVYAGTSAVIGVQHGEVKIYGVLGRGEKKLLVVDTNQAPYAKLVYRPEPEEPLTAQDEKTNSTEPQASPNLPETASSSRSQAGDQSPATPSEPSVKSTSASVRSHSSKGSTERTPVAKRAKPPNILTGQNMPKSPLRSPGYHDVNLPTPTAPSPTPLATRPKISIPVRSAKAAELPNPEPKSALSTWSSRSVLSDDSATSYGWLSQASQLAQGNELLNRYLTTPPNGPMFDGQALNSEACFSPITPFDEMAPSMFRSFKLPPDNVGGKPIQDDKSGSAGSDVATDSKTLRQDEQPVPLFHRDERPVKQRRSSASLRTSTTHSPARRTSSRNLRSKFSQPDLSAERRRTRNSAGVLGSPVKAEKIIIPEDERGLSSAGPSLKSRSRMSNRIDTSSPQSATSHSSLQHLDFTPQREQASRRTPSQSDVKSPTKSSESRQSQRSEVLRSIIDVENVAGRPPSASQVNERQRLAQRTGTGQSSHRRTRSTSDRGLDEPRGSNKVSYTATGNNLAARHGVIRNQQSDIGLREKARIFGNDQPRPLNGRGDRSMAEALLGLSNYNAGSSSSASNGKAGQRRTPDAFASPWSPIEPTTPTAMLGLRDEARVVG
ncbi:N-terminal amidase [Colletotrichum paranaense]|uniref:N-terminal amidase n=1 Tax=Colletotrichum paranaense TaxID=1914294 RepID=A0ABQ9SKI5_9PEZI|nr:N-terminal amidase [Colletotrichum paranaense]KAK1538413.1 N-terminal amidase [Colletotrichum paranaense]